MEKPLSPIFDDTGTEVSREVYWGQKELAAALGTTAPYVGNLLRTAGLLRETAKEPTAEALNTGAAIYVTVSTADGPHRYPRWRKDLVLGVLSRALEDHPKPLTKTQGEDRRRGVPSRPVSQTSEERISALEHRIEYLERRLILLSGPF